MPLEHQFCVPLCGTREACDVRFGTGELGPIIAQETYRLLTRYLGRRYLRWVDLVEMKTTNSREEIRFKSWNGYNFGHDAEMSTQKNTRSRIDL
jgi:hypothetical protein